MAGSKARGKALLESVRERRRDEGDLRRTYNGSRAAYRRGDHHVFNGSRRKHRDHVLKLKRQVKKAHRRTSIAELRLDNYRRSIHSPLRLRALHVAETLIGVMEHGGNNAGPMVAKIIHENGGVIGEPWCGDFDAYCYRHAGSRAVQRGWASTLSLGFLAGMKVTGAPEPGDIVVFNFPGGQSSDHTGLFVKRTGPGEIETIEGNTGESGAVSDSATGGDGVYRKRRSTSLVSRYVRVLR